MAPAVHHAAALVAALVVALVIPAAHHAAAELISVKAWAAIQVHAVTGADECSDDPSNAAEDRECNADVADDYAR